MTRCADTPPRFPTHRAAAALCTLLGLGLGLLPGLPCRADGGVTFHDFAATEGSGIDYRRTPSEIHAIEKRLLSQPVMNMGHVIAAPEKPRGAPGVAFLDFDGDGDLDLYVTNGPGTPNSLFANRLVESGELGFEDVAAEAGVAAASQDSTGVCFGDTDNDGDPDLLVLGRMEPNRLFVNRGDGTFAETGEESGLGGSSYGHASCSFGDVDGDGLLDVAVANSFDWASRHAIFNVAYALSHPNQLFRNLGKNRFADVSESSGIRDIRSVRPPIEEGATLSWSVVLVDYDRDGDLDLFHADDQAALSPKEADRAHVHLFENDGTGKFESATLDAGLDVFGAWMGLTFADFDCDGRLDLFATNWGDYAYAPIGFPFERGQWSSRWFLQGEDGSFADPGLGDLRATPFGWAPIALDYDNDADPDVIYLGALGDAIYTVIGDNPGAVLQNRGCEARFTRDADAMTTVHNRRVVEGAAAGDLNRDGFPDVVSVSSFDVPADLEAKPYGLDFGSAFDATAVYYEYLRPAPGGNFVPKGVDFPDGRLVIDLNSGDNGNGWTAVRTVGAVGLTEGAVVNRSGIGALVTVHPEGEKATTRPVMGGSNYASQDALELTFGLAKAESATVEVQWPGGVRNRLYDVEPGERVLFPEIPCSFEAARCGAGDYLGCVTGALDDLVGHGVLDRAAADRFRDSALRACSDAAARSGAEGAAEASEAVAEPTDGDGGAEPAEPDEVGETGGVAEPPRG